MLRTLEPFSDVHVLCRPGPLQACSLPEAPVFILPSLSEQLTQEEGIWSLSLSCLWVPRLLLSSTHSARLMLMLILRTCSAWPPQG